MSSQAADSTLRAYYRQEFERLRAEFEASGSGVAAVRERTTVVDRLASQLWDQYVSASSGVALVALGGFGRRTLFPYSDVDLLFLAENEALRGWAKDPVRAICQEMWDIGLRVSPTTRTLDECARFDQDNVEFTISLLDCRFLVGDRALFERLHDKVLPQLVARESDVLVQRLAEVTRTRHLRFGNTIFHLEPNLKDGPGGLRDTHVTQWLSSIATLDSGRKWPESLNPQHSSAGEVLDAMEFLSASRCYLHYRSNRDENVISWEAQDEMAARGIATARRTAVVGRMDAAVFPPGQGDLPQHARSCWSKSRAIALRCIARSSAGARASPTRTSRLWMAAFISSSPAARAIRWSCCGCSLLSHGTGSR